MDLTRTQEEMLELQQRLARQDRELEQVRQEVSRLDRILELLRDHVHRTQSAQCDHLFASSAMHPFRRLCVKCAASE